MRLLYICVRKYLLFLFFPFGKWFMEFPGQLDYLFQWLIAYFLAAVITDQVLNLPSL